MAFSPASSGDGRDASTDPGLGKLRAVRQDHPPCRLPGGGGG